jgi:hypothetical protein
VDSYLFEGDPLLSQSKYRNPVTLPIFLLKSIVAASVPAVNLLPVRGHVSARNIA